jgi:SAM-dependent methyltransferase
VTAGSGAKRIFLYNWPTYVGTWVGATLVAVLAARGSGFTRDAAILAAVVSVVWSLGSLVVSFYIYDRSVLAGGTWIPRLLSGGCETWATIHAGLDAEIDLAKVMPGRCVARMDIFDDAFMTAPSIRRARLRTPASLPATACRPTALTLGDDACDAVVVAFTAHEIRNVAAREKFFDEVHRCLRLGGTMLLVEHVRDFANFIAFGPGHLHFLPRAEWLRLASRAGFAVKREERVTPWVMALELEKTP